jgi:hypothetical protein
MVPAFTDFHPVKSGPVAFKDMPQGGDSFIQGGFLMLGGLVTISGGVLAASPFILGRFPATESLVAKLRPYQSWIGGLMFFWGIWETIGAIRSVGIISTAPLAWGFWAAIAVADLLVGFILGFGLIDQYALSKGGEAAQQKGALMLKRLSAFQVPLGAFAIFTGIAYIVV